MRNIQKLGVITLMLTTLYMVNDANAEENKVTSWFKNQWVETVEFQKKSWQDGKEQLAQNKLYIQDLFKKVNEYVSQD